jgi:hypothetical protein
MAPQEEAPLQTDWTQKFMDDRLQALVRPTLMIINSSLGSADRLPILETKRVEMEWEGEVPTIEDLWIR